MTYDKIVTMPCKTYLGSTEPNLRSETVSSYLLTPFLN